MAMAINNPYPKNSAHYPIWEMCVRRDLEGFLAADWSMCEADFIADGFVGWDGHHTANPLKWTVTYPHLESYKEAWLKGAQDFQKNSIPDNIHEQLYALVSLVRIELGDETGIVHKKFTGQIQFKDQSKQSLNWQSIFYLRKIQGMWRQAGFIGYLPLDLGSATETA